MVVELARGPIHVHQLHQHLGGAGVEDLQPDHLALGLRSRQHVTREGAAFLPTVVKM